MQPPAHSSPCRWGLRPWRPLRQPVCAKRCRRRSRLRLERGTLSLFCPGTSVNFLSLDPSHPQWAFRSPLAQNPICLVGRR